jgi:hypothetical protein
VSYNNNVSIELVRAISIHQPHASLLVGGPKIFETRSWDTPYRGLVMIHASKTARDRADYEADERIQKALRSLGYTAWDQLPRGCLIGETQLVDCIPGKEVPRNERRFGTFVADDGPRYAWRCHGGRLYAEPIPYRGLQGWFAVRIQRNGSQIRLAD